MIPAPSSGAWLLALAAVTLLRLAAAATLPLAPDEAYYWVWSRALAPGYFDHPPMVALWIAAGTAIAGDNAFGIRLLGPLGVALGSLALAKAADDLFPQQRAGAWAAALLNATLLVGLGAVLITPDTPLIVCWCLALWALGRLRATGHPNWWLAFGAIAGLALLSKYTAVLLGAGVALWLCATAEGRFWLRRWQVWAGAAIAALLFTPVVLWNASHGWASFAKQGGRAGAGDGLTLRFLGELIGGQIGLATPIVFALCILGTAAAVAAWRRGDAWAGLLVALTVPAAALFLWQATGSRVQGNWPAILYPGACIAAACCAAPRWARWRRPGIALGAVLAVLVFVQAAFAPLPLARRNDPTLARLGGWPEFAAQLEQSRRAAGAGFIAAEEYGLASQLALLLPRGVPVIALGDRWDLFDLPDPPAGVTGLLVRSERRGEGPPLWPGAREAGRVGRQRRGILAEAYRLHSVTTPAVGQPTSLLPRPR